MMSEVGKVLGMMIACGVHQRLRKVVMKCQVHLLCLEEMELKNIRRHM
jgi:hypothetical protein